MDYIWLGLLVGVIIAIGVPPLWQERAWKALIAFFLLVAAGTAMSAALIAGVSALPFSYWLMHLLEPVTRRLFGPPSLP